MRESMICTVESLAWRLGCNRALSVAHCSSLRPGAGISSAWVLYNVLWDLLYRRNVSPSSRHGKLAWRNGFMSTWRRPSSCSPVLALVFKKSCKNLCAVCCSGVSKNSIECSQCELWFHKRCSSMTKQLVADPNYVCPRCNGMARLIDDRTVTQININSTMLDVETTFNCIGNMLCSGGGWDSAIAFRCCVDWGKFRRLLPVVLTTRQLILRCTARCTMFVSTQLCSMVVKHGGQIPLSDLQWLRRNDYTMIR